MGSDEYICGAETKAGDPCQKHRGVDGPEDRCPLHDPDRDVNVGHPEHEPTEATEAVVEALAMEGHDLGTISEYIDISPDTIRKHYNDILDRAEVSANAQVVQTAFRMATSGKNPSMTKYWLNCRTEEWESKQNVDVTSDDEPIDTAPTMIIPDNGKRRDDGGSDD